MSSCCTSPSRARRVLAFVIPLALGACMLPSTRDVAPAPHAALAAATGDRTLLAQRRAWAEGARLVLASESGAGTLRYGVDWFGMPGARDVPRTGLVFAGLSDALLETMPAEARGRVAIVLLPGTTIDEMMTGADAVLDAATRAGASGVLYVLPPELDAALVREAADELEAAAASDQHWKPTVEVVRDSTELPAWFVRYDALVDAAAAADLDLPVLVTAAIKGEIGVAALDGFAVEARLPVPAARVARSGSRSR